MTIGSIFLGLALLIVVVLFLARPFLKPEPEEETHTSKRQRLLLQKEALLTQISELDFDYETGKVPADVYEQQRAELVMEAATVLKQLDEMPAGTVADDGVYADIEAAVARLRRQPAAVESAGNGRTVFCTQCGQPLDPDDNFCAACGHQARTPQPTT